MKLIFAFFSLFVITSYSVKGQQTQLQVGTQIPLNYSIGVEQQVSRKFSVNFQAGILTSPYDQIILEVLKKFGTSEALTNTIGDAFSIGYMLQPTFKFNFGKNYFGLDYSFYSLIANDVPVDAIENYYSVTLPKRQINRTNNFTLTSNLHNLGILYGRLFQFRNPHLHLKLEFSIAKTFSSSSTLTAEYGDVSHISPKIDDELNQYYIDYGYLPSLNVFLVYVLGKKK